MRLPEGAAERLRGYGVMSAPFASGDVLCLRRFPASSIGPAYTSVWHCDSDERWTFFTSAAPAQTCPRYFGSALDAMRVTEIDVNWTGAFTLSVTTSGQDELRWSMKLVASPATRILNLTSGLVPEQLWTSASFLKLMSKLAGLTLRTGRLALIGTAPNGQAYLAQPRLVWRISESRARLNGRDLGALSETPRQLRLGDFWIPTRGLFAAGGAQFELYDATRHRSLTV